MTMDLLAGIFTRRSVRHYTDRPVDRNQVMEIIKAGSWAPSGLNNQPWRFVTVYDNGMRGELAKLTRYDRVLREAPVAVAVFIDHQAMYNAVKDHQSIGACLQNMLLAAHAMGLGAVWLGEILKNAEKVRELFGLPDSLELMAVVALGHTTEEERTTDRRDVAELLLKEY